MTWLYHWTHLYRLHKSCRPAAKNLMHVKPRWSKRFSYSRHKSSATLSEPFMIMYNWAYDMKGPTWTVLRKHWKSYANIIPNQLYIHYYQMKKQALLHHHPHIIDVEGEGEAVNMVHRLFYHQHPYQHPHVNNNHRMITRANKRRPRLLLSQHLQLLQEYHLLFDMKDNKGNTCHLLMMNEWVEEVGTTMNDLVYIWVLLSKCMNKRWMEGFYHFALIPPPL